MPERTHGAYWPRRSAIRWAPIGRTSLVLRSPTLRPEIQPAGSIAQAMWRVSARRMLSRMVLRSAVTAGWFTVKSHASLCIGRKSDSEKACRFCSGTWQEQHALCRDVGRSVPQCDSTCDRCRRQAQTRCAPRCGLLLARTAPMEVILRGGLPWAVA